MAPHRLHVAMFRATVGFNPVAVFGHEDVGGDFLLALAADIFANETVGGSVAVSCKLNLRRLKIKCSKRVGRHSSSSFGAHSSGVGLKSSRYWAGVSLFPQCGHQ